MSARDLAILARALIREFPQYSFYWHIPAIKYGRRVVRNYNPLLGRYPGADGMKTGFICASGFNLVATATRDNKQLIAVVLGAPSSGGARGEGGGTAGKRLHAESAVVADALARHGRSARADRRRAAQSERRDVRTASQAAGHRGRRSGRRPARNGGRPATASRNRRTPQFSVLLSALRAPTPKNANLLSDAGPVTPIVVYTGPTRTPAEIANLASLPEAAEPARRRAKHKPGGQARRQGGGCQADRRKPAAAKPATAKPTAAKPAEKKPAPAKRPRTASLQTASPRRRGPWTPMSSSALAASPPPELGTQIQKPRPRLSNVPLLRCARRVCCHGGARRARPRQASGDRHGRQGDHCRASQMKRDGKKSVGVVAWDYQIARIADRAGVDFVSVGDSVGVNLWGRSDPLDVTIDEMLICCRAVRRGVERALVSCDMPYRPGAAGRRQRAHRRVPPHQGRRRRHDQGRCRRRFSRRGARAGAAPAFRSSRNSD